jgi:hypothetical protein
LSRIRLYLDEDAMDDDLLKALRVRDVDTASAQDCGMIQRPDEEHLSYAAQQERTLYTFNVSDFCRLHSQWLSAGRRHAGLIVAPQQRYSVGVQVKRLLRLMGATSAEEMKGRIEFLSNWG